MNNTVVAVFIKNKKLLMNRRGKRSVYSGFLMCPSGHIKAGESFDSALKREMKEELGIDVKKSKYLFTIDDKDPHSGINFTHNFMLVESYKGRIEKSEEAECLVWMSYQELMKVRLVHIVTKLINRLKEMRMIG